MACKYMVFLPVFIVFLIHRIVFSSHYRTACSRARPIWESLMKALRFRAEDIQSLEEDSFKSGQARGKDLPSNPPSDGNGQRAH